MALAQDGIAKQMRCLLGFLDEAGKV
eukprot:SAG11_NODE_12476_length_701_cov_1.207641_1_plen_25_part_10